MTTTVVTVLLAAAVLVIPAIAVAYVLGWANRTFHVEVDPRVEAMLVALPEVNCGGCGFLGCADYAEAVAKGEAEVTLCAPGGAACAAELAEIMGVEINPSFPYRAVVHCAARCDQRLPVVKYEYRGEPTCQAANLLADVQYCTYGCLGLGDCVEACRYDAIHMIDGLATVDYEKCIGCKACARTCPRNIITMVPFKAERMLVVACSNEDSGPDVKAVCTVGCIGCMACTRKAEPLQVNGNLPLVDYDRYDPLDDFQPALDKCPMESLIVVGKPTREDLAAVADEELTQPIRADFKTTVDKTDWRG